MKVVVAEDDPVHFDDIEAGLNQNWADIKIERVRAEYEFYRKLSSLGDEPPDIFVIDMMLPWAKASKEMPAPPKKVEQEGFENAGLRCVNKIRAKKKLSNVPIIIYTVLEKDDVVKEALPKNVSYLQKSDIIKKLVRTIKNRVRVP